MRYELRLRFDGTDNELSDRLAMSLAVNDLSRHVGEIEAELVDTFAVVELPPCESEEVTT